jgi:serine/threonine protein kinase/exonuclease VII small subunit
MYIPGYEILKQIGQGGMSTVYLALQKSLLRKVALKVLSPALVADPIFCERFLKEGKIIAQLSHPHIISIIDIGHHKETYYMSMEYIEGGDLKKQIRKGIDEERSIHIVLQIARALGYAHDRGFVHRDVKPQNILFRDNDTTILTDFGIAKSISDNDAGDLTRVGQAFGSPRYMSPEQVRGKDLNFRSDLYSLGILMYEMLTGSPPYSTNDAAATARMHLIKPVPKLPSEVSKYQKVINNLLAKSPDERYANAWELIAELQEVFNDVSEVSYDDTVEMEFNDKSTEIMANHTIDPAKIDSKAQTSEMTGATQATSKPKKKVTKATTTQPEISSIIQDANTPENNSVTAKFKQPEQQPTTDKIAHPKNVHTPDPDSAATKIKPIEKDLAATQIRSPGSGPTATKLKPSENSGITQDTQQLEKEPSIKDTNQPGVKAASWTPSAGGKKVGATVIDFIGDLPLLKPLVLLLAITSSLFLVLQFGSSPSDKSTPPQSDSSQVEAVDTDDSITQKDPAEQIAQTEEEIGNAIDKITQAMSDSADQDTSEINPQPSTATDAAPEESSQAETDESELALQDKEALDTDVTETAPEAEAQSTKQPIPRTVTEPMTTEPEPNTLDQETPEITRQPEQKQTQPEPDTEKEAISNQEQQPSLIERPNYTTPILGTALEKEADAQESIIQIDEVKTAPPKTTDPEPTTSQPKKLSVDSGIIKMNGRYILSPNFEKALKKHIAKVTRLRNGSIKLSFPLKTFFPAGLQLSNSAKQQLQKVAFVLRNYTGYSIIVIDRSRLEGQASDGLELDRAKQVTGFLVSQRFNPERIHAIRDNPRYATSPRNGIEIFLAPSAFRFFSK